MLISSSGDGKVELRRKTSNTNSGTVLMAVARPLSTSRHFFFRRYFFPVSRKFALRSLPCGDALHTRCKACILDATMARMNRRDCRTRTPKLGNARLDRVEALQKAIRKAKKEGRPLPAHAEKGLPAGGASTAAAPAAELSTSASDFLSQMRAATAKEVSQLRDTAAARSSSNKKRVAMPGSSSSS